MPKCQKNVDYFLEACRKLGVDKVSRLYIDCLHSTMLDIYFDYQLSNLVTKITVLPQATFLISNDNNTACNFSHFATNDVSSQLVATGNGASCR